MTASHPYELRNLSPVDFEALVRDLMQEEHLRAFESFPPGPDQGIDIRAVAEPGEKRNAWLVQCKHYVGSGDVRRFIRDMAKEVVKVEAIKPKRYTVFTSLAISRRKADEVAAMFKHIPGLDQIDVFGQTYIFNLLGQHGVVAERHFKLWLSGIGVLDRIRQAAVINRTQMHIDGLLAQARLFVEHPTLAKARRTLNDHHVCVVSGTPGVGKTTLANMLTLEYMANGFEVFYISEDAKEAEEALHGDGRQIFLYDDFLGRTTLEVNKNEDSRLANLMASIERSVNKRFILTTREHLLKSAGHQYDRLEAKEIDLYKCVVPVEGYDRHAKAMILFNHVYWSDGCTVADKRNLVSQGLWKDIIDHPKYNPRLIETALAEVRRQRRTP